MITFYVPSTLSAAKYAAWIIAQWQKRAKGVDNFMWYELHIKKYWRSSLRGAESLIQLGRQRNSHQTELQDDAKWTVWLNLTLFVSNRDFLFPQARYFYVCLHSLMWLTIYGENFYCHLAGRVNYDALRWWRKSVCYFMFPKHSKSHLTFFRFLINFFSNGHDEKSVSNP